MHHARVSVVSPYILFEYLTCSRYCLMFYKKRWGNTYEAKAVNISLIYTNGSALLKNSPSLPLLSDVYPSKQRYPPFNFVPRFASVNVTTTSGSKGGDTMVFTGAGFKPSVGYMCVFTPRPRDSPTSSPTRSPAFSDSPSSSPTIGTNNVVSSCEQRNFTSLNVSATNVTLNSLTCVTPSLGEMYCADEVNLVVYEKNEFQDALLPTENASQTNPAILTGGVVTYDLYAVIDSILNAPYKPNATVYGLYGAGVGGGSIITIQAYGLDPDSSYVALFALEEERCNMTTTCEAIDSHNEIRCVTPTDWGLYCPSGVAKLQLLRNGHKAVAVTDLGKEQRNYLSMVMIAEMTGQVEDLDVPGFVTTKALSGGGQTVGFAGAGLDVLLDYRCMFYTGTAPNAITNLLYSPIIKATSLELLLCETPSWGTKFPASSVRVRPLYKTNLDSTTAALDNVISSRRRLLAEDEGGSVYDALFENDDGSYWAFLESPFAELTFSSEVAGVKLGSIDYGAKGGTLLNLTVPGLLLGNNTYRCVFNDIAEDSNAGTGVSMEAVNATAIDVSTIHCV